MRNQITIGNLPTEIVLKIFEIHCDLYWKSCSFTRPRRLFPLNAAAVCRKWREITLSSPNLWTKIYVLFPELRRDTLLLVELYLRRSEDRPLTLFIDERRLPIRRNILALDVLELLGQQAHRIETIFIQQSFTDYPGWDQLQFPLLRTAYINLCEEEMVDGVHLEFTQDYPPMTWLSNVPSLKQLFTTDTAKYTIPFPYSQITDFSSNEANIERSLCVLERFPAVETAAFHLYRYMRTRSLGSPFEFPTVRHLELDLTGCPDPNTLPAFCSKTRFPALNSLKMGARFLALSPLNLPPPGNEINDSPELQKWFSCLQITSLSIHEMQFPRLQDTLASLPLLTDFHLDEASFCGKHITVDFLRALTVKTKSDTIPLLPRLTRLSLRTAFYDKLSRTLIKMIQSRCHPRLTEVAQLEELDVGVEIPLSVPHSLQSLHHCLRSGLGGLRRLCIQERSQVRALTMLMVNSDLGRQSQLQVDEEMLFSSFILNYPPDDGVDTDEEDWV